MRKTAKTLQPQGGTFFKNLIGAGLVNWGKRKRQIQQDRLNIDRRVLPTGGVDPFYNDSFVFFGANDEHKMFMSRLAFRGDGSAAEMWLFLDVEGKKFVNLNTEITDVPLSTTHVSAAGLCYTYNKNDDTWKVTFDGLLEQELTCKVNLIYRPVSRMYLSSEHMDAVSTGKAMAEMPWNKTYFRNLKNERQVRAEQGGTLNGSIQLADKVYNWNLAAIRDHSWGKRNWEFLKRYIWNILSLNGPLLINGRAYTRICFTTVDYGTSFKNLVSGWIAGKDSILPIVAATDMVNIAANGEIPDVYEIAFQPKGCSVLNGEVRRVGTSQSWLMQKGNFEVNEAYCQVTIEGIGGQGLSEFGFAKHAGFTRPVF